MADVQILAPGTSAAPLNYTVPGAQEIFIKALTANFDGSAAAGSYVPTVQLIAPGGVVAGSFPAGSTLAAGASADVSWFPGLGGAGSGTIRTITSTDGTVFITGPTGPTTDLSVSTSTVTPADGWISDATETWVYASGAGGGLATFTVTGDVREKYSSGTRIKLTQSATVKYFVVAADTSYAAGPNTSTVTIMAGSDYTLANSAISANFHSHVVDPAAFPSFFNYTGAPVGWSATSVSLYHFYMVGHYVIVHYAITGTSNSTGASFSLPITGGSLGGWAAAISAQDNGASLTTPARATIAAGATSCVMNKDWAGTVWTNVGSKVTNGVIVYLV